MKYYFAAAYARRAELADCARQLRTALPTALIVSSWLFQDQTGDNSGFTADGLTHPALVRVAWVYAQRDVADLDRADVLVSFTGQGGRGGRHVEFGLALADPTKRLVIVGPREHVFHCHPDAEVFPTFAAFLAEEAKAR